MAAVGQLRIGITSRSPHPTPTLSLTAWQSRTRNRSTVPPAQPTKEKCLCPCEYLCGCLCVYMHKCTRQELARARAGSPHQLRDARELLRKRRTVTALGLHPYCDITIQVLGTITSWKSSIRKQVTGFTMARAIPSSLPPSLNRSHSVAALQASSQCLPARPGSRQGSSSFSTWLT